MDYSWPGNVREMENAIEYGLHLTEDNNTIQNDHIPGKILGAIDKPPKQEFVSIEEFVKRSIMTLQGEHKEEEIAETLGISRKNLWEKRKRWGLIRPIQKEKISPNA